MQKARPVITKSFTGKLVCSLLASTLLEYVNQLQYETASAEAITKSSASIASQRIIRRRYGGTWQTAGEQQYMLLIEGALTEIRYLPNRPIGIMTVRAWTQNMYKNVIAWD